MPQTPLGGHKTNPQNKPLSLKIVAMRLSSSEVHTPTSYVEQKRIREVASVVKDVGLEDIKASTICIISATRHYWQMYSY